MSRFARPVLPKNVVSDKHQDLLPAQPQEAEVLPPAALPLGNCEYQSIEIRMDGSKSLIKAERTLVEQGKVRQETFSTVADEQVFQQVAEQFQLQMTQQMDAMFELMFMPWRALHGYDHLLPKSFFR
ncbi:hypothetical protein ACFVYJ_05545 [Pontibacter sp. JAM-7]|uniref:hypothetical protein n=1 Tax=Pontibacter sp. JAM-7 TaxID=3366581 RepID=UPI003AF89597